VTAYTTKDPKVLDNLPDATSTVGRGENVPTRGPGGGTTTCSTCPSTQYMTSLSDEYTTDLLYSV
jgi:hypothetical protein